MYKDRGIIKWAPFDALVGFQNKIDEMLYERGKKERPILCEDKLIEMDRVIREAIESKYEVFIEYYHEGYFKHLSGAIDRIDEINGIIDVCGLSLEVVDVLEMELFNVWFSEK